MKFISSTIIIVVLLSDTKKKTPKYNTNSFSNAIASVLHEHYFAAGQMRALQSRLPGGSFCSPFRAAARTPFSTSARLILLSLLLLGGFLAHVFRCYPLPSSEGVYPRLFFFF